MNKFWTVAILLGCISACDVNSAERNNAGNTLSDQGQYDSALAAYQSAQVASPDSPEAYYNAASAYSYEGDFDKAINALQLALKTTDVDLRTRAFYNLGNIYFGMNRFDDAVEAYRQVLLLDSNDNDARHNLELALKRLIIPSPTPVFPTEQSTDDGSGGSTPTSELADQSTNAASATAVISTSKSDNLSPTPIANNLPATFTIDDAQGILDAVQQAQQPLPNHTLSGTPPSENSGKDW